MNKSDNLDPPPDTNIVTYPAALKLLRDIEKVTGLDAANAICIALSHFLEENFKMEKDPKTNLRFFQILTDRYNLVFKRELTTDNNLVCLYENGDVIGIKQGLANIIDHWNKDELEEFYGFDRLHHDFVFGNRSDQMEANPLKQSVQTKPKEN